MCTLTSYSDWFVKGPQAQDDCKKFVRSSLEAKNVRGIFGEYCPQVGLNSLPKK